MISDKSRFSTAVNDLIETERTEMGRVTIAVEILNNFDVGKAAEGEIDEAAVRRLDVADALIDTGATSLCLPASLIRTLGLRPIRQNQAMTAAGPRMMTIYSDVLIKIFDREAVVRVVELPEGSPVLIGQIPLEMLDFVVDLRGRKLIGNPAHNGEHMFELY